MKEGEIKTEARYTVEAYYQGFRILLTQPFESGAAIIGLLDKMVDAGFTPISNGEKVLYKAPETPENKELINGKDNETHLCPIHGVEMKKWEKGNQNWYSHKIDGGWCTGKKK